jgi:hypothetical protein
MDLYTYRIDVFDISGGAGAQMPDVEGWEVEASDGHIGKVSEANNEASSSCLVVDTGFWLFGKKRMVPAGMVQRLDPDEKKLFVAMTKDQIKDAPEYDPDRHAADEQGYHREVGGYYEPHQGSKSA